MRSAYQEWQTQQLAIINAEYEEEKDKAIRDRRAMSVPMIERRHRIKPGSLRNFRANHLSRAGLLSQA